MNKKILKVMISVLLVATVMTAMVSVANAETKNFNVTATNVDGWSSYDPYSPRAQKSNDGDTKYYVRVLSMSGACTYVYFTMHRYTSLARKTTYEYPNSLCYLRLWVGDCKSETYTAPAPGGYYYFVEMTPFYGYCNINCTGRFTP